MLLKKLNSAKSNKKNNKPLKNVMFLFRVSRFAILILLFYIFTFLHF